MCASRNVGHASRSMRTLKDIILLVIVFTLVFIAPHHLYKLLDSAEEVRQDTYRGCVASANQAAHRHGGSTLEANLEHCYENY